MKASEAKSSQSKNKKSTRKGTDAPLKIILDFFLPEFTQLALGNKFKVLDAKLLDKEKFRVQKPKKHEMDALIETLVEDKKGAQMKRRLHLEFQGPGSHQDMAVRILGYFSVMSEAEGTLQIPIDIVVFYINGAGKKDTGHHILGDPAIGEFNYHVIHLDEIDAEEILESDNLLLLCLIGLSKLKNAEEEVKRAYHKIVKLSPKEDLVRYVSGLMMLLLDNSLIESLEEMMPTGLLMDSPYMLRLERVKKENYALGLRKGKAKGLEEGKAQGLEEGKAKGLEEGKAKGLEEGKAKGLEEGKAKGLEEGKAKGLEEGKAQGLEEGKAKGLEEGKVKGLEEGKRFIRDNIIALSQRFDPSLKEVTALQKQLQNLHDYGALSIALQKVARVDNFADFAGWLAEATEEEDATSSNGVAVASSEG